VNLLLDTHVLLWWLQGGRQLGSNAKRAMVSPGATLWISAVVVWEVAIKVSIQRLKLGRPPEDFFPLLLDQGFRALPIGVEHALAIRRLPLHHSDPFDRMLVAQAQCGGLTLLTADPKIAAYQVRMLDATS
jgi:PIN domain nuclease of toxin-antitoxin system